MAESSSEYFGSEKVKQMLEELKQFQFRFCSVSSAPSVGTFTSLQKTISYHGYLAKASVLSFFDVSSETLAVHRNEVIRAAVGRLNKVLNSSTLSKSIAQGLEISENEKEQFVFMSSLLHGLTGTFSFNVKEYSTKLFSKLRMKYNPDLLPMGMGSIATWHGAPDGYSDLVVSSTGGVDDEDDLSDVSTVGKASVEAKLIKLGVAELNQVTGHSVVMSFIHLNRHPDQNSLIPAIGICGRSGTYVASLYDCHKDILLHLHPVQWLKSGNFVESAIFLLWLILHHKYFLCFLADATEIYKSGLSEIFRNTGVLGYYQSLNRHDKFSWICQDNLPEDLNQTIEVEPCMKKRKI